MNRLFVLLCVTGFLSVSLAAPVRGVVKDNRDGKTYKTVKIGDQTWMAENLNLHMDESWCYEQKTDNCKKYGRLYTWKKALKACPTGWHLPTIGEWRTLESYLTQASREKVGNVLRAKDGWKVKKRKKKKYDEKTGEPIYLDEYETINAGTDNYGFSALPAGYVDHKGKFVKIKENAVFWSATKEKGKSKKVLNRQLEYGSDTFYESRNSMDSGFSVRCVKD